jgi:hypothetical protein
MSRGRSELSLGASGQMEQVGLLRSGLPNTGFLLGYD